MFDWGLIYLVLIVGACLQSVIGFGLGLLCAPVLFLIFPHLVPAPMILNALLLTSLIAARNHSSIDFKQTAFSIAGGSLGVIIASSLIVFLAFHEYRTLFGVLIVVAVALSFLGFRPAINSVSISLAGILSGFMGTLTSAGGAPMALLYQTAEHKTIKANLSIFFMYINGFGIISLWLAGAASIEDLILFAKCAPAILFGWLISGLVNKRINADLVHPLILAVAFCSGLTSIIL